MLIVDWTDSNIKSKIDGGAKQILLENSNLIDTSSGLVVTALGKSGTIGSRKGNKKSLEEQLVVEKGSKTISRSEARRISLRNAVYKEKKKEVYKKKAIDFPSLDELR